MEILHPSKHAAAAAMFWTTIKEARCSRFYYSQWCVLYLSPKVQTTNNKLFCVCALPTKQKETCRQKACLLRPLSSYSDTCVQIHDRKINVHTESTIWYPTKDWLISLCTYNCNTVTQQPYMCYMFGRWHSGSLCEVWSLCKTAQISDTRK
jgi:hypothetical protein